MKKLGDVLLSKGPLTEILMGNYGLVRAMLESGVKVVTSYPGSPTPEIGEAITSLPEEKNPMYFEFSVNEKVALEISFGAAINGHHACTFFKSVGMNVVADTFVQLSLMNIPGGLVIILGDDPGANSSQNEQDNRHYARLSYLPVFEPKNAREAYAMFKEASHLSQEMKSAVIIRLSTHICHSKEKFDFGPLDFNPNYNSSPVFSPENGPYIPLTSKVFPMKEKALQRLEELKKYSQKSSFHEIIGEGSERGIITAGLPFSSLMDVLENKNIDILRLGMVHPLPEKLIVEFLNKHKEVKILEELDDFLEQKIKSIAFEKQCSTKIHGKKDIQDWLGEYTPDKVREVIQKTWPDLVQINSSPVPAYAALERPPQMCPGCGHRSGFYAIKKALDQEDITVADIGCHTLGYLPPYNMGQVLLCMGHAVGTASGLSLFNNSRKVVAFMGDSTLFHAGLPGIINAIFNQHNCTLIIMENDTTAMTGHQDNPASGKNTRGPTKKMSLATIMNSLGVEKILETDTYNQEKLTEQVKEAITFEGFSVVIAKHPCMLKFTREQRKKGRQLKSVQITENCRQIHECVSSFGCPSFQLEPNGEVIVHHDLCIGDGSCIQTCPIKAIEVKK